MAIATHHVAPHLPPLGAHARNEIGKQLHWSVVGRRFMPIETGAVRELGQQLWVLRSQMPQVQGA